MAVRTINEVTEIVMSLLGDNNSDENLAALEDITDTLNDLDARARGDGEDWKAKFESNDKMWRERYRSRFTNPEPEQEPKQDDERKKLTYENLFKEE